MSSLDSLYRDMILVHYRHPRNRGSLPVPPAASMMSEACRSIAGFKQIMSIDNTDAGTIINLGDLEALKNVRKFPVRIK